MAAIALSTGCTLVTDVDRSKIPAAEIVPPDPPPPQRLDAGEEPADGGAGDAGDAGAAELDAGGSGEPDAGDPPIVPPLAPADAGADAAADAG